ncbi:putative tail-fiber protein [Sinorhizobium phage phiM6]|nr:putative tail-fiber protein [Sinorhizobium phage phiM6]
MSGYTRQSLAEIQDGEDIVAAPLNDEFDALQDAFNSVTGHVHDGTVGNAPKISLTGAVQGILPITNGGTGGSTAATARTNLGLGTAATANTGTSGATLPFLNGTNSWSGVNTFTGVNPIVISSTAPGIVFTDTDTGVTHSISANSSVGSFSINIDTGSAGSAPLFTMQIKGVTKLNISQTEANYTVPINMDATSAGTTRTNLGLAIGTNVQAYDAALQSISGLTTAADRMIYTTGADTYAVTTLTSTARTLLDDTSTTAMRTTLGVYSTAQVDAAIAAVPGAPTGTVIMHAANTAPTGYLECSGAAVSRTTYSDLFAVIGTVFGAGDGSTTFNLPNLRGEFVRGWDNGRGIDTGRVFGSAQAANISSHTHAIDPPSTATTSDTHSHTFSATTSSDSHTHTFSATTSSDGAHTHTIAYQDRGFSGGTINNAESGGATGTFNTGSSGAHTHTVSGTTSSDAHTHTVSGTTATDAHSHTVDIASFTSGAAGSGTDTRPRNIALLYCIKT